MSVAERAQMMGIETRTIFKRASAAMAVYLCHTASALATHSRNLKHGQALKKQASIHTTQPIHNPVPSPKALRSLPKP